MNIVVQKIPILSTMQTYKKPPILGGFFIINSYIICSDFRSTIMSIFALFLV